MDQVMLGLVDGHIPFVLTRSIGQFRCRIPVLPDGDGATTAPLVERTARCTHQTWYLIGAAPTCPHHIRAATDLARGNDPDAFSPDLARLPWPLEPCKEPQP